MRPARDVDELAHRVIGAAIEVHRALGPGYLESVYEEALALEFALRDIPFKRQHGFAVEYKGARIGEGRVDLLVAEVLVVELKAVDHLLPIHSSQTYAYLKALDLTLALLINFRTALLRDGIKRIIRSP